jgi:hypothetical protein
LPALPNKANAETPPAPNYGKDGTLRFWIDTICVPLALEHSRKAAVKRKKDIYEKAEYVQVLDAEIM